MEGKHTDPGASGFDREIKLRGVLGFAGGVVLAIVLFSAVVWWVSIYLRDERVAEDPAPSVMPEARQPYQPPGPRLQNDPEAELDVLRVEEERALTTYQWVDEAAGVAQIPVERAMEVLAAEAREPAVEPAAAPAADEPGATATEEGAE